MEMEMEMEMEMIRGLEMKDGGVEWDEARDERQEASGEGRREKEKGEGRTKKGKAVMMEFSQPRDHLDGFR